ncbi:type II secretion system F family protein [Nesterenkonia natronophila]|nr:type II secretion system F family protein [Nesterenkonia natronophila]
MMPVLVLTAAGFAAALVLVVVPAGEHPNTASPSSPSLWRRWGGQLEKRFGPRPARMRKEVAELLRQFSALLVSGRGEGQAWEDLRRTWRSRDPDHTLFRVSAQIAASEAAGTGTAEGLRRYVATHSDSDPELTRLLNRLIAVTALSEQTGAPLSELVEQLADSIDEAAELAAAVETATAGPKLTQLILTLLPAGGLVLGQIMGASPLATLLGSSVGILCLTAGLFLLGTGRLWSRHMIRKVTRRA